MVHMLLSVALVGAISNNETANKSLADGACVFSLSSDDNLTMNTLMEFGTINGERARACSCAVLLFSHHV